MKVIALLYHKKVRESVLDRAIHTVARAKSWSLGAYTSPLSAERPARDSLVLVRNSELQTALLEREYTVYPTEEARQRSKNKWTLYNYCTAQNIPTPHTLRAEDLLDEFVFKYTSGSNNSVVNPFAQTDVLAQHRIDGQVVKCYGHIHLDRFIGSDELTRKRVEIPDEISAFGRKVLRDFGLVWGGLDWVIGDQWYLIDVNATSGFGYASLEESIPLLTEGLEILFYETGARRVQRELGREHRFTGVVHDDIARH